MSFRSRRKPPAAAAKMTADQEREIIDQWRAERANHGCFEEKRLPHPTAYFHAKQDRPEIPSNARVADVVRVPLHPAVSKMIRREGEICE